MKPGSADLGVADAAAELPEIDLSRLGVAVQRQHSPGWEYKCAGSNFGKRGWSKSRLFFW